MQEKEGETLEELFRPGRRLMHQYQGGEYEVVEVNNRGIMKLLVVDRDHPKKKWREVSYRLSESYEDWIPLN